MQTLNEESALSLFSIEEVPVSPRHEPVEQSGCDLCQHCTLLRAAFLKKRGHLHVQVGGQGRACIDSVSEE
ncbi:MAG: hypothetical protein H0W02_19030 [Ktedonobacteraceae bacterium]|nr:hypothetical protein [Ktedonobacteraceae bacterium]